jgi:hypothetical protein
MTVSVCLAGWLALPARRFVCVSSFLSFFLSDRLSVCVSVCLSVSPGAEVPFVFGYPVEIGTAAEAALSTSMGCYWCGPGMPVAAWGPSFDCVPYRSAPSAFIDSTDAQCPLPAHLLALPPNRTAPPRPRTRSASYPCTDSHCPLPVHRLVLPPTRPRPRLCTHYSESTQATRNPPHPSHLAPGSALVRQCSQLNS